MPEKMGRGMLLLLEVMRFKLDLRVLCSLLVTLREVPKSSSYIDGETWSLKTLHPRQDMSPPTNRHRG